MLEYLTYQKFKKRQAEKDKEHEKDKEPADGGSRSPMLSATDEEFLERMVSDDGDAPPPLPDRPREPVGESGDEAKDKDTTKGKAPDRSSNRWSFLPSFVTKKISTDDQSHHHDHRHHKPGTAVPPGEEAAREADDIAAVLEKLNLAADHNHVFSLSKESRELVQKFTLVLKDLVNGVPTAYDDLVGLLDSSQGQLEKSYGRLPPYLQKLVRSLPRKMTGSLGPELLATAAAAQGTTHSHAGAKTTGLRMPSLKDMVTKPGAVAGILRAIMNFLKLRWPAFMGTSVLWSLGLFVLLLVFWYCHKRGREVRLAKEKTTASEGGRAHGLRDDGRVEELEDDYTTDGASSMASAASAGRAAQPVLAEPSHHGHEDHLRVADASDRRSSSDPHHHHHHHHHHDHDHDQSRSRD
ncbi:MAG: hypothetical protein M1826_007406 [Phylliscum demangeonii]|nr:MAG: hypothetical protein M1826_007406 [Phylliscum demangeonii]